MGERSHKAHTQAVPHSPRAGCKGSLESRRAATTTTEILEASTVPRIGRLSRAFGADVGKEATQWRICSSAWFKLYKVGLSWWWCRGSKVQSMYQHHHADENHTDQEPGLHVTVCHGWFPLFILLTLYIST
ncbi:unnamed protein product [Ilex paraguariensis]|uniref:Uncharacterized protein n=1 Tax=Ilex paraguariensis TaxID=185542 RepID=A0ABC8RBG0_9AQUA